MRRSNREITQCSMDIEAMATFVFRWSLGLAVFNFLVFFAFPPIREPVGGALGLLMEPLLLGVPITIAGLSLLAWLITFLWKDGASN